MIFLTVLSSIFMSFHSFATDYSGIAALCSQQKNQCLSPQANQLIKQVISHCETEVKVLDCEGLGKSNPEMLPKIRKCDFRSICREYADLEAKKNSACFEGYKKSLIDTGLAFRDTAFAVGTFIENSWEDFKKNVKNKNEFIKQCDKSLACKRDLVKEDRRFNKMSDKELQKMSAAFLYVQSENLKAYKSSLQRVSNSPQSSGIRGANYASLTEPQKNQLSDMMAMVMGRLKEEHHKFSCYSEAAQREMACYMVGNVVDPTLLFAATFKTARMMGGVVKGLKSESVVADLGRVNKGRRLDEFRVMTSEDLFGKRLKPISIANLPESMAVAEYKSLDGSSYMVLEKSVLTPGGEVKKVLRELPVDRLTGAFDANYPAGREFLEGIIKEKSGQVSFAFIDVNNLGYVNKNFSAGREAGDLYIKKVAEALKQATGGKAQMFKLGGDEFGLVIHETDPKKVKEITDKILKATYSKDVHDIFKSEKMLKAQKAREGQMSLSDFKDFAPYSKEGISVGTTQIGPGENFDSILHRAEEQAKIMKIKTKEALNIDATKYGGASRDSQRRSDLTYVPEAPLPVQVSGATQKAKVSPALGKAVATVNEFRQKEVYRFGQISVAEYKDELGRLVTRYERYLPGTQNRTMISREVVMNKRTGFIDGTHEGGRQVLQEFVQSSSGTAKSLLWINTENLGKVNYFKGGTQSGDILLRAASDIVKREMGTNDIPFKMEGSEMILAVQNVSPQKLKSLQKRIEKALLTDPQVRSVFTEQKIFLESQLKIYRNDSVKKAEIQKSLEALENVKPQFTLKGLSVDPKASLSEALNRFKDQIKN